MYRYALLGLLQGLTEFLPVSSSGHLVLAQRLLGLDPPGVALEGAVHLGTLLAVVVYFRKDLIWLLSGVGCREARRYLGLLMLGTLPVVAVGLGLRGAVEQAFSSVSLVGALLLVTAAALAGADWAAGRARRDRVGPGAALAVGVAQAASLLPGVSRSAITISAGMFAGVRPEAAARFSFLLAVPAVLGAGMVSLWDAGAAPLPAGTWPGLAVGAAVAALSGLAAIHALLALLRRRRLRLFAAYCGAVGVAAIAWSWLG
ncbi:MAG: undecaprenyl-diphosphate phosphatase [Candidatus Bipolaricaulaceae bacterium]